jgi:hypothetical protein
MANYSRVSDKSLYCKIVAKPTKQGEVSEATGWYVGGTLQTGVKYKNKQFTCHLLRPNGQVIGVNFTPGATKQYLNGQLALSELVGKFVSIKAGETVMTERGPFTQLEISEKPAPSEMPANDIKICHFVDLDAVKSGQGLHKRPTAANVSAEDMDGLADDDDVSSNQAFTEAASSVASSAKPQFNSNPFAD